MFGSGLRHFTLIACFILCRTFATAIDDVSSTKLALSGDIDASTLFQIVEEMPQLQVLDLTDAKIVVYDGDVLHGKSRYPANTIPDYIFAGTMLQEIIFPQDMPLTIGQMAFMSTPLKSVLLPENTISVGTAAFADCTKITSVTLANAEYDDAVFANCTSLEDVNLAGATTIGARMFQGCSALEYVDFGTLVTSIGEYAFSESGLTNANISGCKISTIADWSFANCASLDRIYLPSSLNYIGRGAFINCEKLKTITFSSVATIGDYALANAPLTNISAIPSGVEAIGDFAFKNAEFVSLKLPGTLKYIGSNAMENVNCLSSIDATSLADVPDLGEDVWNGVAQADILLEVAPALEQEFSSTPQWNEFNIQAVAGMPIQEAENMLTARFLGYILQIIAPQTITKIELFSPSGVCLLQHQASEDAVFIDTSSIDGAIFIVRATLADESYATFKLAR